MQTRTYGELFKTASALIGTGGQLAVGEQDQLRHFINRRFQQAFDESPVWPRYFVPSEDRDLVLYELSGATSQTSLLVNQRYRFAGTVTGGGTNPGTNAYNGYTYNDTFIYKNSSNAWVVATGAISQVITKGEINLLDTGTVQFTETDTVKNDSIENVKTWDPRGSSTNQLEILTHNFIPYEVNALTSIGDFNRIHREEAFRNNSSSEYDFFVDSNGANLLNVRSGTTSAFVSYKKQFTPYTVTSGYYDSTVEVPGEFFNYIAHSVYADFLRVQNRQEQALAEEQVAQTYLALELEKIDIRSNNNTINKRFSTYVNRQAR